MFDLLRWYCLLSGCLEVLDRYAVVLHVWRMVARIARGVDPFIGWH